jgi:hypothetical protein
MHKHFDRYNAEQMLLLYYRMQYTTVKEMKKVLSKCDIAEARQQGVQK